MRIREVIESILKDKGMKKSEIAHSEGVSLQLINYRMHQTKRMTISVAVQMLNGCGYKLVAIPKGSPLPKDSYEVEGEE